MATIYKALNISLYTYFPPCPFNIIILFYTICIIYIYIESIGEIHMELKQMKYFKTIVEEGL